MTPHGLPIQTRLARPSWIGLLVIAFLSGLATAAPQTQPADQAEHALKNAESDPAASFLHARALADRGQFSEAKQELVRLIDRHPEFAEPYNNLAVILAEESDLEGAQENLSMALRNNPDYATAHANLGDLYLKRAMHAWTKAAEIDPEHTEAAAKSEYVRHLFLSAAQKPARRPIPPPPQQTARSATNEPAPAPQNLPVQTKITVPARTQIVAETEVKSTQAPEITQRPVAQVADVPVPTTTGWLPPVSAPIVTEIFIEHPSATVKAPVATETPEDSIRRQVMVWAAAQQRQHGYASVSVEDLKIQTANDSGLASFTLKYNTSARWGWRFKEFKIERNETGWRLLQNAP